MPHAAMRSLFDTLAGFSSARLPWATVDPLRPAVFRHLASLEPGCTFLKTHDLRRDVATGEALFPAEVTRAVVYLVRDPCDVVVSYAAHENVDIDTAMAMMNDDVACLAPEGAMLHDQFPQPVGGWSMHVRSWLDDSPLPTQVLRYEDLHAAPGEAFANVLATLDLPHEPLRVRAAVAQASFDSLRRAEQAQGFVERKGDAPFFRAGEVGAGRRQLTRAQRARLVRAHGTVMARFGYLERGDDA